MIRWARWETAQRWYEAELIRDLFGTWVVRRRWGGKYTYHHGMKSVVVSTEARGQRFIEQIHQARLRRKPPYRRVD